MLAKPILCTKLKLTLRHSRWHGSNRFFLVLSLFVALSLHVTRAHFVAPSPQWTVSPETRTHTVDRKDAIYASWTDSLQRRRHTATSDEKHRHKGLAGCFDKHNVEYITRSRNETKVYFDASQGQNARYHYLPCAVAYAKTVDDVVHIVQCAASHGNIQTTVRSGGHSFAAFSSGGQDGALIVDVRHMDSIRSDGQKGLVHLGPGAMLGDVVKTLYKNGKRATPHGTCPTVAVGGHALCGGFGPTSHKWGMMVDNVVEAQVVLANGSIVQASQHENYDLWWALRGAGSFYGIVTSYTLTTYDVSGPATSFEYTWTSSIQSSDDASEFMMAVQDFGLNDDLPDSLGFHVAITVPSLWTAPVGGTIALHLRGVYLGPLREAKEAMSMLWKEIERRRPSLTKPDRVVEKETTFVGVMELWDDFAFDDEKLNTAAERTRHVNFVQRSALSMGRRGFSKRSFSRIISVLWQQEEKRHASKKAHEKGKALDAINAWEWNIYFELFGSSNSRMNDAKVQQYSSFVHRDGLWLMQASVGAIPEVPLIHGAYEFLHHLDDTIAQALDSDGIPRRGFSCYTDPTLQDWKERYFGNSLPRLVDIKRQVDPLNLFRTPQSLIETPFIEEEQFEDEEDDSDGKEDGSDKEVIPGQADIHPLPRHTLRSE